MYLKRYSLSFALWTHHTHDEYITTKWKLYAYGNRPWKAKNKVLIDIIFDKNSFNLPKWLVKNHITQENETLNYVGKIIEKDIQKYRIYVTKFPIPTVLCIKYWVYAWEKGAFSNNVIAVWSTGTCHFLIWEKLFSFSPKKSSLSSL